MLEKDKMDLSIKTCKWCEKDYYHTQDLVVEWCPQCRSNFYRPYAQACKLRAQTQAKEEEKKVFVGYRYLVTLTRSEKSRYDKQQWLERVAVEGSRATFKSAVGAIEHISTNIHAHLVVEAIKPICHTLFKVFKRDYGRVHTKRIHVDNGVAAYCEKELPQYKRVFEMFELVDYYTKILATTNASPSQTRPGSLPQGSSQQAPQGQVSPIPQAESRGNGSSEESRPTRPRKLLP